MKTTLFRRGISLLLALGMTFSLALGCTACGGTGGTGSGTGAGASASAASMFLRKTEGTVAVADGEGADIALAENLGLYSGYTVGTEAESYAWIDLDQVKLTKLDENSAAEITRDGKTLTIDVATGSLFFNVTEPLTEDETMEIRTSSMLVGIRGTCGWAAQNVIGLLEGTVTVTAGDETATINAGERAWLSQDGTLQVGELSFTSIPAFAARELLDDEALQQTVLEASGLYIPTSYEDLLSTLEQKYPEREFVYSGEIDFERDESPEFLVVWQQEAGGDHEDYANEGHFPYRRIQFTIYRNGPEGVRHLTGTAPIISRGMTAQICSLVERDGRLFLECRSETKSGFASAQYFGSIAGRNGSAADWGETDRLSGLSGTSVTYITPHDERGFVTGGNTEQVFDVQNPYTPVRELCRADGLDVE